MDQEFQRIIEDILAHPQFQELRSVHHHGGDNSLYIHSVDTAWCAYRMARRFHMSPERVRSVTRAALLHDFFGYNWHSEDYRRRKRFYSGLRRITHMHAFIHGAMAARRADRLFGLSQRQRDAITSHMFPLAPVPRNSEAWVLTLADKVVASREVGETVGLHMSRLRRKKRAARRAA